MQRNEIEALLNKYSEGSLDEAERQKLASLLQNSGLEQEVIDTLQDMMLREENSAGFDTTRFLPILEKLLAADKAGLTQAIKPARKRNYWMRYAAAAVLTGAIATWLVLQPGNFRKDSNPEKNMNGQAQNGPLPSQNRPVLKLAGGREVFLDSAQGSIVQQNQFIITNKGGKLGYSGNTDKIEYHTLSTPRGIQYQLQLPDGTHVWLNAASSISYPTAFAGNTRNVTITGEAYFEVARDRSKPFFVNVHNKASVRVLGTHFNIRSYPDDKVIKTTLLEGKIKIIRKSSIVKETSVILTPGQQAVLPYDSEFTVHDQVDLDRETAWRNGYFDFREVDLQVVMKELSRWYDVDIQYEGTQPNEQFEGKIPMNAKLDEVLKLLEKNDVRFRREGNKLTVLAGKD